MTDDVTRICARLLRAGSVPRAALPGLDFPEVRGEVERRLQAVGLVLATSAYSEHVAIRLSSDVTSSSDFDAASNLGLRSDACALLVILWSRLVLRERTATAGRPRVRLETLVRDLRSVLGGRSHIQRLVAQLRRLRFLAGFGDVIEAGPLLELGIDGERMAAFLHREVLAGLLERGTSTAEAEENAGPVPTGVAGLAARVLAVLEKRGGIAAMGELSLETGELAVRLRAALQSLAESGYVRRTGERGATRYHLVRPQKAARED